MTWQYASECRMWYTLRRGKIVYWILLVAGPAGHEYRPYSPKPDRVENGPQWVQREPCQTLKDAKRVATSPVETGNLPS